jgi:sigma-B regulation protein RsbU (phosphoserine phosphatase)
LDGNRARVRYANAAQPALLRLIGDQTQEESSDGPFLGLVEDTEIPMREFEIAAGERLFIYTDGLSDQPNADGVTFDLAASIRANAAEPLSQLVERITAEFDAFRAENTTADDVTLVAIEVAAE